MGKRIEDTLPPWELTVVYGSPNLSLRRRLFSDLSADNFAVQPCWLICGDFNSVTSREEVSNPHCFYASSGPRIFREGLMDPGYEGSKFTWMRGVNTSRFKAARLDRAFGNEDWKLRFPNTRIQHLPIINSDHAPLLITNNPAANMERERKFRFNFMWTTHRDFMKCVQQTWKTEKNLEDNKQVMAESLLSWNKEVFGNVFHRKKRLIARINGVQKSLAQHTRQDLIRLDRELRVLICHTNLLQILSVQR
ncbi:uncharacterized protein LOC116019608 [Ipomoea triloba]|uniref:uncharacterized protein LOC116019608 n=1 Tax=Ipomoea triloba TaxID=35885 RepID=UPI00125DD1E1|nr:uncharacterized protein LOC116019608 [Ipomoea triloba]